MRRCPCPAKAFLLAVLIAVVMSGCTGSDTPAPDLSPTTSGSSSAPGATSARSSSAADPATEQAVLTAYRGYWAQRVKAQAAPSEGVPTALATYAVDKAAADVASSLVLFTQQGIEIRGEPVLSPAVTAVTSGNPATASIRDCVDSTNWTPVFADTGASALPPGQPTRVIVESTASTYAGRWVIRTSTVFRDRTC